MNPMILTIQSKYKLNNGLKMPYLGLGTWKLRSDALKQAVKWAIEIGYRHFDTARYYQNEKELGQILKEIQIPRKDIFITSKLWLPDFGFKNAIKAFNSSLNELNLDYIDQYLIHWPKEKTKTQETWKGLEKMYNDGKCNSIGVSNFSINDLEELKKTSDIFPTTNQIEFHPYKFNEQILEYCKNEKIAIVSYSPLAKGSGLNNPNFVKISNNHKKTVAQVFLRWGIQHDTIVIPKSANKIRLNENAEIFDFSLTKEEMNILDSQTK